MAGAIGPNDKPARRGRPALVVAPWAAVCLVFGACADFENLKLSAESACILAHPPAPAQLTSLPSSTVDFTVVARLPDLGDRIDGGSPPFQSIGYDLDDACTTADLGYSCREPDWAVAPHADGPGGVDNAFGADLYNINLTDGGSATDLVRGADALGDLDLAIKVRGYNQQSVAHQVDVAYYGVRHRQGDAGPLLPLWDGTDDWDVYTLWLQPPEGGAANQVYQPMFEDPNAYVTAGGPAPDGTSKRVLVSRLPGLLVGGTPLFHMSLVIVTAEVVQSGGSWTLANVVIAGRVGIDEFLHHVAFIDDPTTHTNYCTGRGFYANAKKITCAYADIAFAGPDDGTKPCDAVSWGWKYVTSVPVRSPLGVGPAAPPQQQPPPPCPPGTSPADDHCGP